MTPAGTTRGWTSRVHWRQLALGLLMFAQVGILIELWLLRHYEDPWQWSPLVLLSLGLLCCAWVLWRPGPLSLRIFGWLAAANLAAGAVGIFLHMRANLEFELELDPDLAGWTLIRETLTGAFPALAPGTMFQLGLLAMLIRWQHPNRHSKTQIGAR